MKRIEVFISEGDADRRLGMLEYDELRGKEVSSFELDEGFVLHPSVGFLGPKPCASASHAASRRKCLCASHPGSHAVRLYSQRTLLAL